MKDDDAMASEEEDNVYANDENFQKTSELLQTSTLDQLLADDNAETQKADEMLCWYHGKISREAAEKLLQEAVIKYQNRTDMGGLFLVRDSTISTSDFSLSLTTQGRTYHFQIQEKKEGYYHIDDGPLIHGLERLIQHYTESANGLPTNLESFCRGKPPPHAVRKTGPTTLLHRVVLEGNTELVEKILQHPRCPPVDAKNTRGSTALHLAAYHGYDKIVELLLKADANKAIKDKNGHTALHRACVGQSASTVRILLKVGKCDPQVRCPQTGWVPLHEAAYNGSVECVKALLELQATPYPRNDSLETPVDLAEKYRRFEVMKLFDNIQPAPPKTSRKDWYHPELDRQGAIELLENRGLTSGLFIIRPSKRQEGWHALTLCFQRAHYHYEIKNTHYRGHFVHFIDDGPYLLSLEELVQHYSLRPDGLPCALRTSINTSQCLVELPSSAEEYCNLPNLPFVQEDEYRPDLPPRPSSIADEMSPHSPASPSPPTPGTNTSRPPLPSNPPPAGRSGTRTPEPDQRPSQDSLHKISPKHIKKGNEIGQGEYGSVIKGTLTEYKGKKQKTEVAIKMFHDESVENRQNFLKEAVVMQLLDHPCIVSLLGVCEGPPLMLVEEYLPKGSMLDFLLDYPEQVHVKPELYLWAAQIANGMVYLEKKNLVHRDLAARNILIKDKTQVKISDFGLSRATGAGSDYYKASHGGRWPIKWYAPESVNYGHFSHASDVWSFGITLWEMFSYGESPYGDMKGIEVVQYIESGKRLKRPEKCTEIVYRTMRSCWEQQPEKRPTFHELNKHFQEDETYADVRDLWQRRRDH